MALTSGPARDWTGDPYGAFNYVVEVGGLFGGGFSEVTGLQTEVEVFDYREGGRNEFVHKFAGPARYPSNLILKRGLSDSDFLWDWHQEVLRGRIRRVLNSISVILLDQAREEAWRWVFREAYPVRWVGPELRAGQGAVAIETLEFAHQGLDRNVSGPVR